jgi:hypothetical protein
MKATRLVSLLLATLVVTPGLLAQDLCDPGLESSSKDPQAYRQREDRCEGLYRLKVNSDKLRLRSWTVLYEPYDPRRPLEIGWRLPPGAAGPVRLRATALSPQTYYRMDTRVDESGPPWIWTTTFLERLDLERPDLGLLGWIPVPDVGAAGRPLYLPLVVHQGPPTQALDTYRVVVVPGERLAEIEWSIAPVGPDGHPGAPLDDPVPLQYGIYPSRRPIEIAVPAPDEPGIYVLNLTASLQGKAPAIRQIWFYNAGVSP